MANEIHKGDIGTAFQVTLKDGSTTLDLSTATTKQLKFKKPAGTIVTKTASFITDGTDGAIEYVTVDGDLDEAGNWNIQAYIVIGSTAFHSDLGDFIVYPNLE